ncbi:MAG: tetraacyldisaccharide 4'-kinase [Longimicrobiales bacterium]|nr:tetraacyldisaccharide 4'-kinase [Longimicrobiales bacterium]
MRRPLERFAWRMWRGQAGVVGDVAQLLLLPLECVWRLATRTRNRRYDRRRGESVEGLSVVSLGNLAVGGTGKTPLAAWTARCLVAMGARPALLLRGYGQDEVALHRSWNPEVPVEAGADRVESARRVRAAGADVAVLDDGFQHRRLARGLDVVLLASEDPLPGPVLPRGPYREPLSALRRADLVIFTRRSATPEEARARQATLLTAGVLSEDAGTASVHLGPGPVRRLADFQQGGKADDWSKGGMAGLEGRTSVALTAIARPHAFRETIQRLTGSPVELVAYADHHDYSAEDVRRVRHEAGARPIFITEKDAVKLVAHAEALGDAWVVGQRLTWDWGEEEVLERLRAVVAAREEQGA